MKHGEAVAGTHQRIGGALGVRHHAENVSFGIQDPGDRPQRAVGIVHVAKRDTVFRLQLVERPFVGNVTTLPMRDRYPQDLPFLGFVGEW